MYNELNTAELIKKFKFKKIRVSHTAFIIFSNFILSVCNYIKNSKIFIIVKFQYCQIFLLKLKYGLLKESLCLLYCQFIRLKPKLNILIF